MPIKNVAARFGPVKFVILIPAFLLLFARFLSPLTVEAAASCNDKPDNPVAAENCLPGSADWQMRNYLGDIEGYVSDGSVNLGEKIDFFVNTTAPTFDILIFRSGYYGGAGGRLVQTISDLAGKAQPTCNRYEDTGLRTCSNWVSSYTLSIPTDWVSGVYVIKLLRHDTGGENYIQFVIRDDSRKSTILYQESLSTFTAYNSYAGKSTYYWNSDVCLTVADSTRAVKVSLNRPEAHAIFTDPNNYLNTYFRAEYPMVRWLEEQGYDVTYSTSLDTHRSGKPGAHNALLDHKVFLSVGHDEYWSQEMHDAITVARDAGVSIGFFSSNTSYWRVRFEPDPVTNEPDSVMVTYKTTESGGPDPSGHPTGTWRDPEGVNNPENSLLGVMYIGDNDKMYFPLRLSSEYTSDRLYRHTGLQDMPADSFIDVGDQIIGWEWDSTVDNGLVPQDLQVITDTPVYGFMLKDAGRYTNGNVDVGNATATRYIAPSGAIVFASGSIQWSWGLGAHGLEVVPPDPYISQMTYNVFADMGAQPTTPSANIILDGSDAPDPALPTDKIKSVSDVKAPVISNVQASVDGTSATITWTTDVDSTGQVWYGTEPDHVITPAAIDTSFSQNHSLVVTGLTLGTTYYLKVTSVDHDWAHTISDESSFVIPAGSFSQRLQGTFNPLVKRGACWVRANQIGAIFLVILGVVIVVLLIAPLIILRRRARLKRTPA